MKDNFISILITNYNKSKFLRKSLKSLLDQKYKNFEIILFDDCSEDNSIKIIEKFKKVKLIKNKKKKYISSPLNQINGLMEAFKYSRGKIICLMDADDYFKKNKLFEVNKYFELNNKKKFCIICLSSHQEIILRLRKLKKIDLGLKYFLQVVFL